MDTDAAREVATLKTSAPVLADASRNLASALEEVANELPRIHGYRGQAMVEARRCELLAQKLRELRMKHGRRGIV